MIYRTYESKTFSIEKQALIRVCDEIIREYRSTGYDMTLRQLYYQLVALNVIENNQRSYNRVKVLVGQARMAGLLPWDGIVDRMRQLVDYSTYDSPWEFVHETASWYRRDLWEGQAFTIEVWVEKDALSGVFSGVCNELRIPLFVCRGYASLSEMWGAGKRIQRRDRDKGRGTYIIYFGDHDPSGVDMTRDIQSRLSTFVEDDDLFIVNRVALSLDQVRQYNPPPNFAKETDSRINGYLARFGTRDCWELDALRPNVLVDIVRQQHASLVNQEVWDGVLEQEEKDCQSIKSAAQWIKSNNPTNLTK